MSIDETQETLTESGYNCNPNEGRIRCEKSEYDYILLNEETGVLAFTCHVFGVCNLEIEQFANDMVNHGIIPSMTIDSEYNTFFEANFPFACGDGPERDSLCIKYFVDESKIVGMLEGVYTFEQTVIMTFKIERFNFGKSAPTYN